MGGRPCIKSLISDYHEIQRPMSWQLQSDRPLVASIFKFNIM